MNRIIVLNIKLFMKGFKDNGNELTCQTGVHSTLYFLPEENDCVLQALLFFPVAFQNRFFQVYTSQHLRIPHCLLGYDMGQSK